MTPCTLLSLEVRVRSGQLRSGKVEVQIQVEVDPGEACYVQFDQVSLGTHSAARGGGV